MTTHSSQWDIILEMIKCWDNFFFNLTDQRAQNQRISGLEGTITKDLMNILSDRELTAFQIDFPFLVTSEIFSHIDAMCPLILLYHVGP